MKPDLGAPGWRETLPPQRALGCGAPITATAFSADGAIVAFAAGDGGVRRLPAAIDGSALPEAEPAHKGAALSLIADPAGPGFVSGGDDGRLLRHDADGAVSEIASHQNRWVERLAGHRGSRTLAASAGKFVLVERAGARREIGPYPSTVSDLDLARDGTRVATAHYGGVTVTSLGDPAASPRRFAWRGSHLALRWSPDLKFLATGTQESDIHVWRLAQATDMRMQGYPSKVKSLAWSADARFLFTSSQPVFTAWPFAGKGPEGKPPVQFGEEGAGLITVVATHPAGDFVAGGYDSGEIQLGDMQTKRSVVLRLADGSAINCIAWSPDGWKLAVGTQAGDQIVIDLRR